MTEDEFLNKVHRNYGLLLRYIWRKLPDLGREAFIEMDNSERVTSLNKHILSQNPFELKIEMLTNIKNSEQSNS